MTEFWWVSAVRNKGNLSISLLEPVFSWKLYNQNTPERTMWHPPSALIGWSACHSPWEGVSRQELVSTVQRGETAAKAKCLQCLTGRSSSGARAASAWCRRTAPSTAPSPWTSRSGSRIKRWAEAVLDLFDSGKLQEQRTPAGS